MNVTKNAATAFAAIVVLVSMIALSSNNAQSLFADPTLPQYIRANQADQLSVAPFGPYGTFSQNQSLALPPAILTGIGNGPELPSLGLGHGSGDGTAGGPALPSVSAAVTLLNDTFDRANNDAVGEGWVEVELAGSSTVSIANNKLFFDNTSDGPNRPLVKRSFTEVSTGTVEWGFDFDWTRTGPEAIYRFMMQLGDSNLMSDTSQNGGIGVNLIWTNTDAVDQNLGFRQGIVDTALQVVSGPNHISVVADLGTKTYSVAVNDVAVRNDVPFDANVPLNQVRFLTDAVAESNFSGRTVDNVIVIASDGTPPVNIPPVAQSQPVSTGPDQPIDLLLTYTDPDGPSPYTFINGTLPSNGTLTGTGANRTYAPNSGFIGSDSFTWQVEDGLNALSNFATVSISVTESTALLSDNFDRPDSFIVGEGWVEEEQAGASAEISANQLHFATTADLVDLPVVERAFAQVSTGTLQWDFDFDWTRTGNEGTYRFLMQLGDSATMSAASQDDGAAVNLIWTSIDGVHQSLGYRDGGVNTALTVVSGAAKISVVANLDTSTYSVSVDGLIVDTGIPFDGNGPLNLVRFFTDSLNEANFSGRNIDNVEILSGSAGNLPPVAQSDDLNTPIDTALALMLVFTDPDGPGPYTFTIVTPPINGVLLCTGADCTYTPGPGFTGGDSFEWSVNDSEAESNIATMTVTVLGGNVAPVAVDDMYATFEGITLNVGLINGVLANDTDANGDPLTAQKLTDPPAASGVLTAFNNDGTFTFVPAAGFTGGAQFTYVALDSSLSVSNAAVVTIDVAVEIDTLNLQPINGQTNVSINPTLEIDCTILGTTAAQYQIATGLAFATVVYDSGLVTDDICSHLALPEGTFSSLNISTSYFWRGRIKDDQGVLSPYSSPTSFTTVGATPTFTNIFQDGFNGYSGTGDADIRGDAVDPTGPPIRNWNQGAQDVIRTGRRLPMQPTDEIYRSLIDWDVTGLTDSSAVVNAYIELTGWHHTDSNHEFDEYNSMYELNKPWGEGQGIKDVDAGPGEVSWMWTANPVEWTTPGAASASDTAPSADRSETALVNMVLKNLEGHKSDWSSQKLVDAVKGWIDDPASNHGVFLKSLDESSKQTLHTASKENPAINFRPKLVIESTQSIGSQTNNAPVAQGQSVVTGVDQPIAVQLTFTDPDGPSPYTYTNGALPSNGTLTGTGANRTYTPNLGFIGADSFTWQVKDGLNALSNFATVTITVTETEILFFDDFNRATSPDLGTPDVGTDWVEVEQVGASAEIAANKLFFADTSDATNRPLVRSSFPPVSTGTLQWDFDFDWARNGAEGTYRFLMQLGDGSLMSDASQDTGVAVSLIWTEIDLVHQSLGSRDGGNNTPLDVVSGPAAISVTADLDANTYSVAVNSTVVGTGILFDSNVSVDTVRFFTDNLNEANFSGRTIDNVSISASDAPPPVNVPPVAQGKSVNTGVDTPLPVTLIATDAEQCDLTFSIVTQPANGSLGVLTDQPCVTASPNSDSVSLVYTPDTGFTGPDTFSFKANDTFDDSNTAIVTVTVGGGGGPTILLDDNFDRANDTVVGEGWAESELVGSATVSIDANKLFFDNTSNQTNRPVVRRSFTPVSTGTLHWDFDFDWARTGVDSGYELWMQLGDSTLMKDPIVVTPGDRYTGVAVDLRWGNYQAVDQRLVSRQNLGGTIAPIGVISGPTQLSVTVDLASKTYSVAINGVEMLSGLVFEDLGAVSQIDTVRFFTHSVEEANFAERKFDNMLISQE